MNFIVRLFAKPVPKQSFFLFSKAQQKTDHVYKVYSEKTMQMISDLSIEKTPTIDSTHINNIAKNIVYVEPKKQEPILNFLLQALKSRTVDIDLLRSDLLLDILKYYPLNQISLNLHIIELLKRDTINEKAINEEFDECFKEILPKIKKEIQIMKARSVIYKSYGKYQVDINNIKKGLETLEQSMYEHKKLIGYYTRKLEQLREKPRKGEEKEDQTIKKAKINTVKENIRLTTQSMFQTMIFYYTAQKESSLQLSQKEQKEAMNFASALIKQGMYLKKIIPHLHYSSIHYHRLRRIELELQYHLAGSDKKKMNKILDSMHETCKYFFEDLKKAHEYVAVMKEIALNIMKIKIYLIKEDSKDGEQIEYQLKKCRNQILKSVDQSNEEQILPVVDDFIKKNTFDLN